MCYASLARCLVLSLGAAMRRRSRAGGEPAKAQRRKTGARKSPHCAKGRAPSQFIGCPRGNKSRAAYPRAKRGAPAAIRDFRGAPGHQPLGLRSAECARHTCANWRAPCARPIRQSLPPQRWASSTGGKLRSTPRLNEEHKSDQTFYPDGAASPACAPRRQDVHIHDVRLIRNIA